MTVSKTISAVRNSATAPAAGTDAGDYGKICCHNAGITMATFFLAWDHFNDRIKDIQLDLPDTAHGWPDYLEELEYGRPTGC